MTDHFGIDSDIARASTLPGSFYTSQDVYDELTERVLARAWHFIGHEQQLGGPAHAQPWELMPGSLSEPLAVVGDAEGRTHVLSNVCTHRANLVVSEAGGCTGLRCRYHGRSFELDGRHRKSPEFEGVANFPSASDDLPSLPVERLGRLLFTSLDPHTNFASWSAPLRERLGDLWDEPFVFDAEGSRDYHVEAHWALYIDNFLEGFHIPYVHPGLNKLLVGSSYETELQAWSNLQLGDARESVPSFVAGLVPADAERKLAAYYAWLFPNLMLNFYPWGLSINVVEPLGLSATRVRFLRYVARPELLAQGAGGDLEGVQREDEVVVESVQRGVRSRLYRAGRFSASQERGVHHFHSLLARALASESG